MTSFEWVCRRCGAGGNYSWVPVECPSCGELISREIHIKEK